MPTLQQKQQVMYSNNDGHTWPLGLVIGLLPIFLASSKEFWLGIGVGMLLQGALMLTADIFAERRGAEYIRAISSIQ